MKTIRKLKRMLILILLGSASLAQAQYPDAPTLPTTGSTAYTTIANAINRWQSSYVVPTSASSTNSAYTNRSAIIDQVEATRRETVKLDNAPEPGYQFKEYVIHQVGDTSVKVQPLGNFFTMPDFDVEVSAIFEKSEGENQDQQQQQQDQQQQDQQDQEQQQDQQNQDQQQQQQQNQQQQSQQMSKEDAQRMLDALENQEKKTMEKVNEQKVRQQPKKKSDKDW